jgi:glycosyl transferase family 25
MKIFIISLEGSDRRDIIRQQLNALGYVEKTDYEIFNAINGRENSDFNGHVNKFKSQWLTLGRDLTPPQIGCWASHYLLWNKCVELNEPIVVLEDDVYLFPNAADILNKLMHVINDYHFIRLDGSDFKTKRVLNNVSEKFSLHQIYNPKGYTSTMGYILSVKAANQFVSASKNDWYVPVDNFLGLNYLHRIPLFEVHPSIVFDPEMPSLIVQSRAEKKSVFYRKISRQIYRFYLFLRML